MQRSLRYLATLPESDLLEHLRTMPIRVLRAFHRQYGLTNNPKSGQHIPFACHAVILERLQPETHTEPAPAIAPTDAYTTSDKADAMAARAARGQQLRHDRDFLAATGHVSDRTALVAQWSRGDGKLRVVGVRGG